MRIGIVLLACSVPAAAAAQDRAFYGRGEIMTGIVSRKPAQQGANGSARLGGNGSKPLGGPGYQLGAAPRARTPLAGTTSRFVRRVPQTAFETMADSFAADPARPDDDPPP